MYAGDSQVGADGEKHSLDPGIGICPAEGIWIYELCRQIKPQATLEIGLAYGFSTLYLLAALAGNGNGRHTSVDPYQLNPPGRWAGIGLAQARRLGGERFRFIEEPSFAALAHLADNSESFDIIFVDGRHLFDFVMAEFTLSAELCSTGGYIILHDMWLPSIQRVAAFIRANRTDFQYADTPVTNIAVFQHTGVDDRPFKHFVEFCDPGR